MLEIRRNHYLTRLRQFLHAPVITAVVGLRRVGKSVLLRQLAETLREDRQVVYIDKESLEFEEIRSARNVVDLIESTTRHAEQRVVIIDEVQQIEEWERAVASLNGQEHTQVVISGSNASMLSGELASRIAGRYLMLQVFPLTLQEFGDLYTRRGDTSLNEHALFRLYLRLGGFPGLLHTDLSDVVVNQMLADIFTTIALRDIIRRHRIRDVSLLEAVSRFVMDNVGSLVSAKRITDFLKNQRRSASVDTVLSYLAYRYRGVCRHAGDRFRSRKPIRTQVPPGCLPAGVPVDHRA